MTTPVIVKRRRRATAQLRDSKGGESGNIMRPDYTLGANGRRKSSVRIGTAGPSGGISVNPAHDLARRLRWALDPTILAPSTVVVTDASGKVVATIDPLTRKRIPA